MTDTAQSEYEPGSTVDDALRLLDRAKGVMIAITGSDEKLAIKPTTAVRKALELKRSSGSGAAKMRSHLRTFADGEVWLIIGGEA